jgi:hypothetical protein
VYRSEFIVDIKDGKVRMSAKKRQQMDEELSAFPDCKATLTIKKNYRQRTLPQNAYIHAYLFHEVAKGLISCGWSEQEINDDVVKVFLKGMFLKKDIANEQTGETITTIQDTSELTTIEMAAFIENVIQWAAENLHVEILYPSEQSTLEFDKLEK